MKNTIKYLLTGLFTIIYILIFMFIESRIIDFTSFLGVTLASILVLVISTPLGILTTNKVVDIIKS